MQITLALKRHGWLTWLTVSIAAALCFFLVYGTVSSVNQLLTGSKEFQQWAGNNVLSVLFWYAKSEFAKTLAWTLSVLAAVACSSAILGTFIMWRAPNERANRQIVGLMLGMASFIAFNFFLPLPIFQRWAEISPFLLNVLTMANLVYLALGLARFLTLFPREVDTESVHESYLRRPFAMRWSVQSTSKKNLLRPWHTHLVSGRLLWIALALPIIWYSIERAVSHFIPFDTWGGLAVAANVGIFLFYIVWGLPYAFASTTHLHQFGTLQERQRVAWLRAILLGFGLILLLSLALPFIVHALPYSSQEHSYWQSLRASIAVAFILLWVFTPVLVVFLLAISVLSGGALDPRLAFTRITLWSILGITVPLIFIAIERYLLVKIVHWFELPPDTGAVAAGAMIAGSFLPLRNFAGKGIERLAARWIPLQQLAKGERVLRAVAICDLSGYTALSAHDESGAILQSTALSRQAQRIAETHGGKLVKGLGDAVMLTFIHSHGALSTVRELHEAFPKAIEALGIAPLNLHSAIHWGELVEAHDGDIFGQTVNLTARLVDAAVAGEIVVSSTFRDEIGVEAGFHSIGSRSFKNVPGTVECFLLKNAS